MHSPLDGAFINEDLAAPTDIVDDMSRPLAPTITVRFGGWQRTFAPGRDVVIGRDVRADVRSRTWASPERTSCCATSTGAGSRSTTRA